MKVVTVTMTLALYNDQPVEDWFYDVIQEQLEKGEDILEYHDDEPVVETPDAGFTSTSANL
jgi:hypothetical protein